jgi:hypothetical protein
MKTIIKSLASKYLVNVLMIAAFGISAATGLFKPGGEHRGGRHDFRSEQVAPVKEISTAGFSVSFERETFERESFEGVEGQPENGEKNIHIYFGLFWLGLMLFHVIQHWTWFKKMFSVEHIMKNKLLTATVVVFVLMAISGIVMWSEIAPRGFMNFREIHEVTGQLLLALMLIHVIQRVKWYFTVPARLFKRKTILA